VVNADNGSSTDPALCETSVLVPNAPLYAASAVKISGGSNFNVSVFDGKAGYAGTGSTYGSVSGTFGDGTVEAYLFLNNVATGSPGEIAPYASTGSAITYNWSAVSGFAEFERADVWTNNDPGTSFSGGDPADFGGSVETISGGYEVDGTIDISRFISGTVYVLCGGFENPFQVDLVMSGGGQPDVNAGSGSIDPDADRNMYVLAFPFDNSTEAYETIAYAYTGSVGNRSRFMGVVVDGERVPGPVLVSPVAGVTVSGPNVELEWTNDEPKVGSDVWSDVWVGTDPQALTKVLDAGTSAANLTAFPYSIAVAGTHYWRVDNYLEGAPSGTPVSSSVGTFEVDDSDGDGLPDSYELLYTGTPQGMDPQGDDDADGLTNIDEFNLGSDPTDADSDGDGLADGSESDAGLDPTRPDSDGDGLLDGASIVVDSSDSRYTEWAEAGFIYTENEGLRAFRGEASVGTDPTDADSDQDGLRDGVETNDGNFVDASATGTDPLDPDSDGDGAWDWYEVVASLTDPNLDTDKPNVPYPLPAPDAVGSGPVKVYIMAGQSNMVGYGTIAGTGPGTLETMTGIENKFPHLVAEGGGWTTRDDVHYRGVIAATGKGPLAPDVWGSAFGPELGFGQIMGYHHQEPVLLLKASQGNRAIGFDFLPPGSNRYDWPDGNTYAGYGDPWRLYPTGGSPEVAVWYAGKQYDDCFLPEEDMGVAEWVDATDYPQPSWATRGGMIYECTTAHTSSPSTEPGTGASWQNFWEEYSIFNAADVLDNFDTEYPEWASRGFEIAGFVWWQGHRDQYNQPYPPRYEENLENLIKALRSDFESRYPGSGAADAPFVVSTIAFGGETYDPGTAYGQIWQGQMDIDDPSRHPEFEGNVTSFDALPYWRDPADSPTSGADFHYNLNAETYLLVGDAAGRAMIDLLADGGSASDYDTWAAGYPDSDLSNPEGDFDGDGLSNDDERRWGLDPTSGSSVTPIGVPLDAATGELTYTRRNTSLSGATYSYEYSTGLGADGWTPFAPAAESSDAGSPVEEVTITLPASLLPPSETKIFVRVVTN
jgi:alpha-galactosidase